MSLRCRARSHPQPDSGCNPTIPTSCDALWEEFVVSHIEPFDEDHYETVWAAVARRGPEGPAFGK